MLFMLFVFEEMRLALECETDALDAGRQQANEDTKLLGILHQRLYFKSTRKWSPTAMIPPGGSWPMCAKYWCRGGAGLLVYGLGWIIDDAVAMLSLKRALRP